MMTFARTSPIRSGGPSGGRRRFLGAAVALALLGIPPLGWGQGAQGLVKGLTPLLDRPPAPALHLLDLAGKPWDIEQFRGRVLLVNFWATWCPPCRKEFPSLERVRQGFQPDQFEVLAVNLEEDATTVQSFVGTPGFPVLLDSEARAVQAWPVKGLPTSFLVDRQGRLAFSLTGETEFDDADILAAIRSLLQPTEP